MGREGNGRKKERKRGERKGKYKGGICLYPLRGIDAPGSFYSHHLSARRCRQCETKLHSDVIERSARLDVFTRFGYHIQIRTSVMAHFVPEPCQGSDLTLFHFSTFKWLDRELSSPQGKCTQSSTFCDNPFVRSSSDKLTDCNITTTRLSTS